MNKIKFTDSITFRSLAGIVLLLVFFSVVVGVIGYNKFSSAISEQYADGAFSTADTAAVLVDGNKIDEIAASGGKTEEYKRVFNNVDILCNTQGTTFIYVIQPDTTDYGHITFLIDAVNENCGFDEYEFGLVKETTNDDYREKYRRLYEDESDQELVIRDKGYIETDPHITAMIPLRDSKGETKAILCVQRQMEKLTEVRHLYVRRVVLVMIIAAIVVILGLGLYLKKVLIAPVMKVTAEASRFADENVSTGEKLTDTIKNNDEIGVLAGSIDDMENQIHEYVENLTEVTKENERIGTELNLATKIQKEVLFTDFPAFPDRKEFSLYASMDPAKEVGGDFYDFFLADDDHLCLVIADVSGKGVPAALFMMAAKIMIADLALTSMSPAEVLTTVNDAICSKNKERMFVTVWMGILEISTGRIVCANAGHEYPAIKRPDGDYELFIDKHCFVVGGVKGIRYKEYDLKLEPGQKLFLYTDGVTEAKNEEDELFGTDRMIEALNRNKESSPEKTIENMRSEIADFAGGAEQFDDITMLCMEYR